MREPGKMTPLSVKKTIHGDMFSSDEVYFSCLERISADNYFDSGARKMSVDTDIAVERTKRVTAEFSKALERLIDVEKMFATESKRISSDVRSATDKMAQGLLRIEKSANFDRLERYVLLLERAASAMASLAELERSGKLEKIAEAIR